MYDALIQEFSEACHAVKQHSTSPVLRERALVGQVLREAVVGARHDENQILIDVEVVDDRHEVPVIGRFDTCGDVDLALGEPGVGAPPPRVVVANVDDF
jgi:hypothetical protein